MVFSGLVTAWRFATWPTSRSPVFVIATTEGVVRVPSWLGITTGSPPCITDTTEFVVPKSIPIILLMLSFSFRTFLLQILAWQPGASTTFQSPQPPVIPTGGPQPLRPAAEESLFEC